VMFRKWIFFASLPSIHASSLLSSAMAANPLAVNLALSAGVSISWGTWALAGIVPGLICLVAVPLILYALYPPEASLDV